MSQADLYSEKRKWTEGLTGYHYLVLAVAIMGWMFDTMDQWLFVFAKQHAMRELLGAGATDGDISKYTGIVTMCLMLGWALGGLFFGWAGDKLGRTRTMAITILMYAGFTGLSGLAQTWGQFAFMRFMTGLGVGGEFAAGAALVAETFPAHSRSTALSVVQAMSAFGNVMSGVINLGLVSAIPVESAWRWIFAIGILPGILVFVIFMFIHEPEAWKEARAQAKQTGKSMGSIFSLFGDPRWRRNTLVGITLACVGVVGFWGISVWSAELLRGVLNPDNLPELKRATELKTSFAVMGQNAGAIFGALFYGWMARRIGRRPAFFIALTGCLIVIPCTFQLTHSFVHAMIFFPLMGFMLLTVFGGYAVYFPELFPTRLRSTGVGFCYNVARIITAFGPLIFGQLAATLGIRWAGAAMSCVFVIGMIVIWFGPETKGQPLPE